MSCEQCGQIHLTVHGHEACPGHILSGEHKGAPCTHELGFGTKHKGIGYCKFHGGATETHNKNAQMQILEREVQIMLGGEYEPISDPYTALADLAGRIVRVQEFLQSKVEELDSLRSFGGKDGEQIDVIFAAFERALDRTERTLVNMSRLDLDAKIAKLHARINNDAAATIINALTGALDAAEIKGPVREAITSDFANRLQPSAVTSSRKAITA